MGKPDQSLHARALLHKVDTLIPALNLLKLYPLASSACITAYTKSDLSPPKVNQKTMSMAESSPSIRYAPFVLMQYCFRDLPVFD